MQATSSNGAVHLLSSNAGDEGSAVPSQLQVHTQLISTHEPTGAVEKREFASAVVAAFGTHQLEGCGAAPLMMGGVGVGAELQPAGAVPGVESLHLPTLDAACSPLCSHSYQIE
jgi:hypothetical protein